MTLVCLFWEVCLIILNVNIWYRYCAAHVVRSEHIFLSVKGSAGLEEGTQKTVVRSQNFHLWICTGYSGPDITEVSITFNLF